MENGAAHRVGQKGERAVSVELHRLALERGFFHVDDLWLDVKHMTAQIDHIVVDQYGILILESKVRNGARIRGRDVESTWTAVYRGRPNRTFQNPLDQTRGQESILRQALESVGHPVDPDHIQCAVVFSGADISKLEMRAVNRERVFDISCLEQYLARRRGFAVNAGDWTGEHIAETGGALRRLNRSQDPEVLRRHSEYRGRGASPSPSPRADRIRPSGPATGGATPPPPANRVQAAPSYGARSSSAQGRRTTAAWGRTSNSRQRGNAGSVGAELLGLAKRLLALVAMLSLLWICGVSGMADVILRSLSAGLTHSLTPATQTRGAPDATPSGSVSVAVAKQRFREVSPDLYARAADLDSPQVRAQGELTTFTWHYIQRLRNNAVKEVAFTLAIAPDGTVRSVSTGQ